jgi:DNA-binding response OmpR family regulator
MIEQRPKILVVDDEPFNVDYLEQELEDLQFDTIGAADGYEALEQVAAESPDLILLDIMMPRMDGFEVLSRLKEERETRDIPVIIISALDDISTVVRAIKLGAEDFLPKPFDPTLLEARIGSSLEKKLWRDRERNYLAQIEAEKKRADELLHVILPNAIVNELKANDVVQPRYFDQVAVLFADVVDFTPYSESHPADEVLATLQDLVTAYEELALREKVQKIKTSGDAFMAAAGLFEPLDNPALTCVVCGLEMVAIARALPARWKVRVGIHVGPVLGGIVGRRQYLYDIWGDTVNTAQRIQSHGAIDSVNLSRLAWESVSKHCTGDSLGLIDVKGKGALEIMRVTALN